MYNSLGQKCSDIPIIYIAYKKNQHIWSKGFDKF